MTPAEVGLLRDEDLHARKTLKITIMKKWHESVPHLQGTLKRSGIQRQSVALGWQLELELLFSFVFCNAKSVLMHR